jgi:hypothetical protein
MFIFIYVAHSVCICTSILFVSLNRQPTFPSRPLRYYTYIYGEVRFREGKTFASNYNLYKFFL